MTVAFALRGAVLWFGLDWMSDADRQMCECERNGEGVRFYVI